MRAPRQVGPGRARGAALACLIFAGGLLAGCGGEKTKCEGGGGTAAQPASAPSPPALGNPMAALGLLGNMVENAEKPGPFEERDRSEGASPSATHHAVLELRGEIAEVEAGLGLLSTQTTVPLRTLTERLRELAGSDKVGSILLRVDRPGLTPAIAEELRAAVVAAAKRKPVHCHVEDAADLTYVVLTACTTIGVAPSGSISITGPVAAPVYLRGLLDKLHLQADFLHIGAFKGAAEPLTRTEPSPEMRQTLDAMLDGEYARLLQALAEGRKLDEADARAAVDRGLYTDVEAKAARLVDEIAVFDAWRDARVAGGAWIRVKLEEEKGDLAELMVFLGVQPRKEIDAPHVALLYAVGEVVDGRGSGRLSAESEIASRHLAAAVRAAAADDDVKAIVLRVDSPGGSALASEVIAAAVVEAKAKKPVVVSMGTLAASGGYYISAGASRIFAQPDTLTGSIGVVGGKFVIGPALERLGVNVVGMGRGKRAALWLPLAPWTAEERAAVEAHMRAVYERFKARVAEGRGLALDRVERIAQGRLWIGDDARRQGLVDELGGLDDALAAARGLAKLPDDAPIDVYPAEPTLLDLLEELAGGDVAAPRVAGLAGLAGLLGLAGPSPVLAELEALLGPRAAGSVRRSLAMLARFRVEPVRLVLFPPIGW